MMWASTSSASSHAHPFSAQRLPGMLLPCLQWVPGPLYQPSAQIDNGLSSTRSINKLTIFYQFPYSVGGMRNAWRSPLL
jgi:hypothetical protein